MLRRLAKQAAKALNQLSYEKTVASLIGAADGLQHIRYLLQHPVTEVATIAASVLGNLACDPAVLSSIAADSTLHTAIIDHLLCMIQRQDGFDVGGPAWALGAMALHEALTIAMTEAGAMKPLLWHLVHSSDSKTLEGVTHAVMNMTAFDSARQMLVECGGVEALVALLDSDDTNVSEAALQVGGNAGQWYPGADDRSYTYLAAGD